MGPPTAMSPLAGRSSTTTSMGGAKVSMALRLTSHQRGAMRMVSTAALPSLDRAVSALSNNNKAAKEGDRNL